MNLEPAFRVSDRPRSILLHQGQAQVCVSGHTYVGDGEVRLDLSPRARIHFYGRFPNVRVQDICESAIGATSVTSFAVDNRDIAGFAMSSGGDLCSPELTVKWCPEYEPIVGVGSESTQLARVVFHLFNFADVRRKQAHSVPQLHCVRLQHEDLMVTLQAVERIKQRVSQLKEEGGYELTHAGCIERTDGKPLSGRDADQWMRALSTFLSFVMGRWCEPACAVGFDAAGDCVWQYWASPREPWAASVSWFDRMHGEQMSALFPQFAEKWSVTNWREALHEVIHWYVSANCFTRAIDAGIILTQAGVERLSYEYVVNEKQLLSAKGHKDLRASDKWRLLASSLGMPLHIPPETPELQRMAAVAQPNWVDAPHALTQMRNSLVHTEASLRGSSADVYREAWNLGLWYLELSILGVCGYIGTYGSRLMSPRWEGQVQRVPWEK